MSFHRYDENERLQVKDPAKKRPPNPLRGYTGEHTATDSSVGGSSVASTIRQGTQESKKLLYQLNYTDQRSFISGSCTASMKACHLINAVRIKGSEEKRRALKETKDRVEFIATRQAFNGNRPFLLDSRSNAILLTVIEHYDLNLYGFFAIIPATLDLFQIQSQLESINRKWDDATKQNPHAERPLSTDKYPFACAKLTWNLLILNSNDFLPDGQPLMMLPNNDRKLHTPGNPSPGPSPRESWLPLYPSPISPFLVRADGHFFKEFVVPFARDPHDQLSVLAVLVNAHSKVKAFMNNDPDPHRKLLIEPYWNCLERVIDRIFYVPPHYLPLVPGDPGTNNVEMRSNLSIIAATTSTTSTASTSKSPNAGSNLTLDGNQDDGQLDEESPEARPSDDDLSSESSDSDSDSVCSSPEITHENGLTNSEHRILFERSSDASLPAKERSDAAVMMMMGVRGYQKPFRYLNDRPS